MSYSDQTVDLIDLDALISSHEATIAQTEPIPSILAHTMGLGANYNHILPQLTPLQILISRTIVQHTHKFIPYILPYITNPKYVTDYAMLARTNPKLHAIIEKNRITSTLRPNQIVMTTDVSEMMWSNFAELSPEAGWLTMDSLNSFLLFISTFSQQLHKHIHQNVLQHPSRLIYTISSQFFTQFTHGEFFHYDYQRVSRWSSRRKIVTNDCDFVIVPCHIDGNHWTCLIADIKRRVVWYLDSFGNDSDGGRADIFCQFLEDEFHKYGGYNGYPDNDLDTKILTMQRTAPFQPFNSTDTTTSSLTHQIMAYDSGKKPFKPFTVVSAKNIPRQSNTYDCGVFVSMFSYCVLLGVGTGVQSIPDLMALQQQYPTHIIKSTPNIDTSSLPITEQIQQQHILAEAQLRLGFLPHKNGKVIPFHQQDLVMFRLYMVLCLIEGRLFNFPDMETQ